jgi:hypothetical protein
MAGGLERVFSTLVCASDDQPTHPPCWCQAFLAVGRSFDGLLAICLYMSTEGGFLSSF